MSIENTTFSDGSYASQKLLDSQEEARRRGRARQEILEQEVLSIEETNEAREIINTISNHYIEPDIEDSESFNQVAENTEVLIEERANRIRALASLSSGGYQIPFKTMCETLGIDYDRMKEDLEELNHTEGPLDLSGRTKSNYNPNHKKREKKRENFTTMEEDFLEVLLDD